MITPSDRSDVQTTAASSQVAGRKSVVPMFRPPSSFTPGAAEPCYSPHQFLALTTVGTDPEDDQALWLTEEKVDIVHREGILILKQYFYDEKLDRYVTGQTKPHKRPNLVVRYNRALLARHVLDEVIVYVQEPNGCYREICRARPREKALAEVDPNLALGYQEKYKQVLAKKRTKSQEAFLNKESGPEAVARLQERSRARAERQKRSKPEPIAATPIDHAREEVDPGLQQIVDEATDANNQAPASLRGAPTSSDGSTKGSQRPRRSQRGSGQKKGLAGARKAGQGGGTSGGAAPTVESLLGGTTGFETSNDGA